ncbi:PRELI domain-containing protein 1, mitochondrial-like [Fukomys damarensis]|uniref:PRELI domain-containing protein 1, mitochondrial-like n=1 Tax=Fukomys damarensis TaxID=885580 RepID=UPI0014555749|nr:PRELI domain-containing protein 1, mitochondrial-like [Fukomys damarensis]
MVTDSRNSDFSGSPSASFCSTHGFGTAAWESDNAQIPLLEGCPASVACGHGPSVNRITWNINHAWLMVVEEQCVYCENSYNSGWTEIHWETWVSSSLFGVSRAVQEFGLDCFKSNVTKTMKGFEYILAKLQAKEAKEKAKELQKALEATEKAKDLANKAATKQQQQQQQFM